MNCSHRLWLDRAASFRLGQASRIQNPSLYINSQDIVSIWIMFLAFFGSHRSQCQSRVQFVVWEATTTSRAIAAAGALVLDTRFSACLSECDARCIFFVAFFFRSLLRTHVSNRIAYTGRLFSMQFIIKCAQFVDRIKSRGSFDAASHFSTTSLCRSLSHTKWLWPGLFYSIY